jgi:hypothetical protein
MLSLQGASEQAAARRCSDLEGGGRIGLIGLIGLLLRH